MKYAILTALREDLIKRGVKSTDVGDILNRSLSDDKNISLLIRMQDHHFKLKISEEYVIIMLRQCLNINGLYQKSPYGKAYEVIGSTPLADPDCFYNVYQLLSKRWFLTGGTDSGT